MRVGWAWAALLLALVVVTAWPEPARAHTRSVSYSEWVITRDGASVRVRFSLLDLSALEAILPGSLERARLGMATDALVAHLEKQVRMLDSAGACAPVDGSFHVLTAPRGSVRYGWAVHCGGHGPRRIHSDLLMDAVPAHLHFASLRLPHGGGEVERVLDPGGREAVVPSAAEHAGFLSVALRHVGLGVWHILTGHDHLVFLLALLLCSRGLSDTARTVTGFTVGHSITLASAALGWVSPRGSAVEALIGLSIALVAAENVWLASGRRSRAIPVGVVTALMLAAVATGLLRTMPFLVTGGMVVFAACQFGLLGRMEQPERWRWTVAGVFGLVHGFGFAGALAGLLPSTDQLVPALLGFNVGVEVGQLAVVACALPLMAWWGRDPARRAWLVHVGSAAAAGVGVFWFVTRAFG